MNNIKQKNVIQKLVKNIDLPYSNAKFMNYYSNTKVLNSTDLNNTFHQLLDNDLMIEATLNNTSSYITGPKIYNDETIDSVENGYKAYGDIQEQNYLDILHKVDDPLSSTLTKSSKLQGNVKFICQYSDIYIANDKNELKYSTDVLSDDWISFDTKINANGYCFTRDGILFAAETGVYQLSTYVDYDKTSSTYGQKRYDIFRLNNDDHIVNVQTIGYNQTNGKLMICMKVTDDRYQTYVAKYYNLKDKSKLEKSLSFNRITIYENTKIINEKINSISNSDDKWILAGENGVFTQISKDQLDGRIEIKDYTDETLKYLKCLQFRGNTYIITDKHVYQQLNDFDIQRIEIGGSSTIDSQVVKITEAYEMSRYFFIATVNSDSKTHLYRLNKYFEWKDYYQNLLNPYEYDQTLEITVIKSFDTANIFIGTTSGLYHINITNAENKDITFVNRVNITEINDKKINDIHYNSYGNNKLIYIGTDSNFVIAKSNSTKKEDSLVISEAKRYSLNILEENAIKEIKSRNQSFIVFTKKIQSVKDPSKIWVCPNNSATIMDAIYYRDPTNLKEYMIVCTTLNAYVLNIVNSGELKYINTFSKDINNSKQVQMFNDILVFRVENGLNAIAAKDLIDNNQNFNLKTLDTIDLQCIKNDKIYSLDSSGNITTYVDNIKLNNSGTYSKTVNEIKYEDDLNMMFSSIEDGLSVSLLDVSSAEEGHNEIVVSESKKIANSSNSTTVAVGYSQYYLYNVEGSKVLQCEVNKDQTLAELKTNYSKAIKIYDGDTVNSITTVKDLESSTIIFSDTQKDGVLIGTQNGLYEQKTVELDLIEQESLKSNCYSLFSKSWQQAGKDDVRKIATINESNAKKIVQNDGHLAYVIYNDGSCKYIDLDQTNGKFKTTSISTPTNVKDALMLEPYNTLDSSLSSDSHYYDLLVTDNSIYQSDMTETFKNFTLFQSLTDSIQNLDYIDNTTEGDTSSKYIIVLLAATNNLYVSFLSPTGVISGNTILYSFSLFQNISYSSGLTPLTSIKNAYFMSNGEQIVVHTNNGIYTLEIQTDSTSKTCTVQSISQLYDSIESAKISLIYRPLINKYNQHGEIHGLYNGNKIINIENKAELFDVNGTSFGGEFWYYYESLNKKDPIPDGFQSYNVMTGNKRYTINTVSTNPAKKINSISNSIQSLVYNKESYIAYVIYDNNKLGYINDFNAYAINHLNAFSFNISKCYFNSDEQELYLVSNGKQIYSIDCDENGLPIDYQYTKIYDSSNSSLTITSMILNQSAIVKDLEFNVFAILFYGGSNYSGKYFIGANDGIYYISGHCIEDFGTISAKAYKFIENNVNKFSYISSDKNKVVIGDSQYSTTEQIINAKYLNEILFTKHSNLKWYYGKTLSDSIPLKCLNDVNKEFNYYTKINTDNVILTDQGVIGVKFLTNVVIVYSNDSIYDYNVIQFNDKASKKTKFISKISDSLYKIYEYNLDDKSINEIMLSSKYDITVKNGKSYSIYEKQDLAKAMFCLNQTDKIYVQIKEVSQEHLQQMSADNGIDGINKFADFTLGLNDLNYTTTTELKYFKDINFSNIQSISYIKPMTCIAHSNGVTEFSGYGNLESLQKISSSKGESYYDIVKTDDDSKLINSSRSLAIYDNIDLYFLNEISSTSLTRYSFDGKSYKYLLSKGKTLLTADNYIKWSKFFDLTCNCNYVNEVLPINSKTYVFATDTGLFYTHYTYKMIHDIKSFTQEEALSLYNKVFSEDGGISSIISNGISSHIEQSHSSTSLITDLNEHYIDVNMNDIFGWQQSNEESTSLVINNDIVSEMQFGTYIDGDVNVLISNFITLDEENPDNSSIELTSLNYIAKRWMSGITELYVNIPTTYTYYIPNLYGASNSKVSPETVQTLKNLTEYPESKWQQDMDVSKHATNISLRILSSEYHMDNVLGIQINGNSLPLKIYKDDDVAGIAGQQYRSFSLPSVSRGYDLNRVDEDGNYIFDFACFGSDEQAVKITFYDSFARLNKPWIRIVFDANGGDGVMSKQKFLINDDGTLVQKTLKKCKLTYQDKFFIGWTLTPQKENYTPPQDDVYDGTQIYSDKQTFPHSNNFKDLMKELMRAENQSFENKEEITLYAVWMTYQFSDEDTTLLLDSTKAEFNIDYVEVDKSTTLKDNVAICYGDNK